MKTRNGKIARLPRAIRNQLNLRLDDGDPGQLLVDWLNGLPEVRHCLAEHFAGRPITEQNLSEWKTGGFQEWLDQQTALEMAGRIAENTDELAAAAGGPLTDKMALWVAARYLVAIQKLEAAGDDDEAVWQRLRCLCRDVVALRRGDHHAERLKLDREIFREERRDHQLQALELSLDECKKYPEVAELFREAFEQLKQRRCRPDTDPDESDPIKPKRQPRHPRPKAQPATPVRAEPVAPAANQTESDLIKPKKLRSRTRPRTKPVIPATSTPAGNGSPITDAASLIPPLPPNPTQSDLIQPIEPYKPDPDPEKEAQNRWFRMSRGAEPFDHELLAKLYTAIPKKPEPA